jgi:tetratricopeptide (TPR) repeat protein
MPGPPVLVASQSPVTALLVQADDALKLYRLTLPERSSAYDYYLRVLALEPGNEIARTGLNDIVERYLKLFNIALRNEDMTKAQQHLNRAAMVVTRNRLNPDYSRRISSSQGAIDQIRNLHVQKNLESWNRLLQEPDTISVDNLTQAYENYMQMLKVFPDDNKVHTANDIYAAAFYRTGEQYFQRNELDTSRRLIAMGLAINPQDQKLQDLQQRLELHMNREQQPRQSQQPLPSASRQSFFDRLF